ncbi:RNA polymerase subunit sigma [Myxococcus xanthus]|uniref:RNA polymerase sigma factor n=1 Tax=Myxococcus xanthus TaxID=34 RepID=A0A4Y6CI14_MYXXA|nr:RNA polymerase sigma factor [Myxococcus xanthus]NOJ80506.1 RNA polymerase sigma factor [Myxococcus xanthus]NOJ84375.1 RNA polymerase sigma factor [Myxococcus xanthus]QDE92119.1 RNA polymerase subunit sigma [Myxococcus xanthus]
MERHESRTTESPAAPGDGHRRQFDAFARARRPALVRIARRLCSGGAIDPEDLVQETLERAYRHFDKLMAENAGAVSVWLSTTMSNRFLDHCRRRRTEVMGAPMLRLVQDLDAEGEAAPQERWERVSRDEFQRAIDQLRPPHLRDAYRLHVAGLRYRAIAQQLRSTEGTVGRWLTEARQALRELLGGKDASHEGMAES